MGKPFGYSYLLDMYGVKPGLCDDIELHYRFLEDLVVLIGMTPMAPPIVIHGPRRDGIELYPLKSGVSAIQFLIESSIVQHSIEPTHFSSLDVYSCAKFDPKEVFKFAQKTWKFSRFEENFVPRGISY